MSCTHTFDYGKHVLEEDLLKYTLTFSQVLKVVSVLESFSHK